MSADVSDSHRGPIPLDLEILVREGESDLLDLVSGPLSDGAEVVGEVFHSHHHCVIPP